MKLQKNIDNSTIYASCYIFLRKQWKAFKLSAENFYDLSLMLRRIAIKFDSLVAVVLSKSLTDFSKVRKKTPADIFTSIPEIAVNPRRMHIFTEGRLLILDFSYKHKVEARLFLRGVYPGEQIEKASVPYSDTVRILESVRLKNYNFSLDRLDEYVRFFEDLLFGFRLY